MHRLYCQYQLQFHVVQKTYWTARENLMPLLSVSPVKHNVLAAIQFLGNPGKASHFRQRMERDTSVLALH